MAEVKSKKKKIQRTSVVDQVYESIKNDILEGVWSEGDKIPSEGELADYFEVNRLSVRLALQKLSTLGLIETRVGEGSFVAKFSLQPYFSEIAPLYSNLERSHDVEQLRNLLEGECMNIAIQTVTEEQKAKLKERLDDYQDLEERYSADADNLDLLEEAVLADYNFHYQIIRTSGNRLYMDVYKMLQKPITDHMRHLVYTRSHSGMGPKAFEGSNHVTMYDSIVNGDAARAKRARETMLGIVPTYNEDYYTTLDDLDKAED